MYLSTERPNLMMRLKLKSWFQWNVCISTQNVCISLWNAQNSCFPLKCGSILQISDWRPSRQTYEKHAFQKTLTKHGNSLLKVINLIRRKGTISAISTGSQIFPELNLTIKVTCISHISISDTSYQGSLISWSFILYFTFYGPTLRR